MSFNRLSARLMMDGGTGTTINNHRGVSLTVEQAFYYISGSLQFEPPLLMIDGLGDFTPEQAGLKSIIFDETAGRIFVEGENAEVRDHLEKQLNEWVFRAIMPDVVSDVVIHEGGRVTWTITSPDGHATGFATNRDGEGLWTGEPGEDSVGAMRQVRGTLQWDMRGLSEAQVLTKIKDRLGAVTGVPVGRLSAAHLRALRTSLGLSVTELAELMGVSKHSARSWDRGEYFAPAGVIEELQEFKADTDRVVDELADYFRSHVSEWPMLIPRQPDDLNGFTPPVVVPAGVTLDWWKLVAMRVVDQVPGLWVEWAESH